MLFPVEFIKVVYLDFSLEKKEEKNKRMFQLK